MFSIETIRLFIYDAVDWFIISFSRPITVEVSSSNQSRTRAGRSDSEALVNNMDEQEEEEENTNTDKYYEGSLEVRRSVFKSLLYFINFIVRRRTVSFRSHLNSTSFLNLTLYRMG